MSPRPIEPLVAPFETPLGAPFVALLGALLAGPPVAPLVALALLSACSAPASVPAPGPPRPPNIVLVLADDLGWGELSCQGQARVATPRIDSLAQSGLRFTAFHAAAPVCAPSRCALLTGVSPGRAQIRDNRELQPEGQLPLAAGTPTLASALRARGYATACVGKWGLGGPGTSGDPLALGFDHFHGYLCQRHAHDHYPSYLWRDGVREELAGNDGFTVGGAQYAPDLLLADALAWMREQRDRPFFLYFATALPHLALQVPPAELDAQPDLGGAAYDGRNGYLAHSRPREAYAAMLARVDRDVGALVDAIDELGLARDTLFVLTSDNGPTHDVGGVDTKFFASAGPWRGRKGSVYEGGLRVPLVARWEGTWPAGAVCDAPCAAWDLVPTLLEAAGAPAREFAACDGHSLAPPHWNALREPRPLYFEFAGYGGQAALLLGDEKLVWRGLARQPATPELYDLAVDPSESQDLAAQRPTRVAELLARVPGLRTPSDAFPLASLDELSRGAASR
jgi:arylsulfatase